MGIVSTMITDSRLLAGIDSGNVTDAVAIDLADEIYQELVDLKKLTSEDFLHTQSFIDLTVYQNEYTLPTGFEKIEKMLLVSALYKAPTYTAWAASTAYIVWDKCTYWGRSYICTLAHTSTASFPYTKTYTTNAIMVAAETVTINGVVFTAKAAWAAVNPWDFAIGASEVACLANLLLCIQSATAWTAATFIAISDYNKQLLSDIELVATNPTWHTITITYNKSITTAETSTVWAWWAETWGNRLEIYENYVNVIPMKVDYNDMNRYNELWQTTPVYFYLEDSIRIYPRPTEAVTRGLMLDYIQRVPTITTATDDAALWLEDKFHKAWKYGLVYKMQEFCSVDSSLYRSDYEIEKDKCHTRWSNRHHNKVNEILPDLSNYRRN